MHFIVITYIITLQILMYNVLCLVMIFFLPHVYMYV